MLQTRAYAKATHQPARSLAVKITSLEKSVESRIARQKRLTDERNPLVLHALIDEAALRRLVGGADVMIEQLRHLLGVSELPNVTIQVIPEAAGAYAFISSAITILSFADPRDRPSIYVNTRVEDNGSRIRTRWRCARPCSSRSQGPRRSRLSRRGRSSRHT